MRQTSRKPRSLEAESRIVVRDVRPAVDGGAHPAKRIAGRPCPVEAAVFRDGHEAIRASLRWRGPGDPDFAELPMARVDPGLDLWRAEFTPRSAGRYEFRVAAWSDPYTTWLQDVRKRADAGQPVAAEIGAGLEILKPIHRRARGADRDLLASEMNGLKSSADRPEEVVRIASGEALGEVVNRLGPRDDLSVSAPVFPVTVDRPRAEFGAWYEMFPRSQGTTPGRGSTFREAERRLEDLRTLGFDVVYLPPIHPIGRTNRKGRNNSLTCAPDDPGSPWAIGSGEGGHDAVAPELGTLADFDHFVAAAGVLGLEVALDFALQCSPDHPWVREHPEWFYRRPDGTIRFAENPPKKYEDIYPLNFDTPDRAGLWGEIRRVLEFWIGHGVTIFRVDNPHTKPLPFWKWLIADVKAAHPDALFLAEAFTRPPMMHELARAGFTQSYTYFTWRNTKPELTEYLTELTRPEVLDYFRPNFFVNTPDILPQVLAHGGPPAFKMRLALAATLSPSYGMYSGYELCERDSIPHHAIPGDIEYADSEKFEIKVRDWAAPGNIRDYIARVNAIRRDNPALHRIDTLRFFPTDNDHLLGYAKATSDRSNVLLVVVNLDPSAPREGMVTVPVAELGLPVGGTYAVEDLVTGARYSWSERNFVRLDPQVEPAHILRVVGP